MNNELISHFSLDMNDYNYERTLNCKRLNKRLSVTVARWPITATTITKRSTIKKEHFTNKKDLLTSTKGLLPAI